MDDKRESTLSNKIIGLLDCLDNDDFPKLRKRNIAEVIDCIIVDLQELKEHIIYKDGKVWITT
jgi:hypothetical protein